METVKSIDKKLTFASILVVISVLFSTLQLFIPTLNPTSEAHHLWFQRSGSFVVLASIWAEFVVVRLDGYFDTYNEKYMLLEPMRPSSYMMHNYLSKSAIVLAIYGTFIWGYGDLLFKNT